MITTKQEPLQSIHTFLQELNTISKTCDFAAVTAEENRKQYVRDAFINGLSSAQIRQRLLENNTLTLDDAFQQARALEQAQSQAASYNTGVVVGAVPINENQMDVQRDDINSNSDNIAAMYQNRFNTRNNQRGNNKNKNRGNNNQCRFCGLSQHVIHLIFLRTKLLFCLGVGE